MIGSADEAAGIRGLASGVIPRTRRWRQGIQKWQPGVVSSAGRYSTTTLCPCSSHSSHRDCPLPPHLQWTCMGLPLRISGLWSRLPERRQIHLRGAAAQSGFAGKQLFGQSYISAVGQGCLSLIALQLCNENNSTILAVRGRRSGTASRGATERMRCSHSPDVMV